MQIVGYDTGAQSGSDDAALVLAEDGLVRRESLAAGDSLAFALGDRHCAGRLSDDEHESCANQQAPFCDTHESRWPCARCTGDCALPIEACREPHAVYLAAFAPSSFKVGVTRQWRLETRLREQGADRGAHLRTVDDGRVARQIETELATDIGDRVRLPTKMRGLGQRLDEAAWAGVIGDFEVLDRFAFTYGLDLTERPLAETMATGTVRGTKGRILVIDRAGSTYAVDMRDLVGHEVTRRSSDRNLQASLGAFDA